jgi:hypothetical protein
MQSKILRYIVTPWLTTTTSPPLLTWAPTNFGATLEWAITDSSGKRPLGGQRPASTN